MPQGYARTFVAFVLVVPMGCAHSPHAIVTPAATGRGVPSPALETRGLPRSNVLAALERTRCSGSCPAYRVTVRADGTVDFDGERFVMQPGHHVAQLTPEQLRALIEAFERANYGSFSPSYQDERLSDEPAAILWYAGKEVRHDRGEIDAPAELTALEDSFDRIVDVDRWLADPRGEGPGIRAGVTACYRHVRDWRMPVGRLDLLLTVASNGEVTAATVQRDRLETKSPELVECILSAARRATLLYCPTGTCSVLVPLQFVPPR
jgi:hypothetical protein